MPELAQECADAERLHDCLVPFLCQNYGLEHHTSSFNGRASTQLSTAGREILRSSEGSSIKFRRDRRGQPLGGWIRAGIRVRSQRGLSSSLRPPDAEGCLLSQPSRVRNPERRPRDTSRLPRPLRLLRYRSSSFVSASCLRHSLLSSGHARFGLACLLPCRGRRRLPEYKSSHRWASLLH